MTKKIKQMPRTELADQIRWWDYFDEELYMRICRIKSATR
jgi:hypothetical protein